MSEMKKMMMNAGIPYDEYFVIRDGSYYWNEEIPVVTDAELFDEYVKKAEAATDLQKKAEYLYEAFLLYH